MSAWGNLGFPAGGIFAKAGRNGPITSIFLMSSMKKDIVRHLAVRDYLRTHPADAKAYGQLKRELAARYPLDWEAYCDGKDAFVKDLEKRARNWYQKR